MLGPHSAGAEREMTIGDSWLHLESLDVWFTFLSWERGVYQCYNHQGYYFSTHPGRGSVGCQVACILDAVDKGRDWISSDRRPRIGPV